MMSEWGYDGSPGHSQLQQTSARDGSGLERILNRSSPVKTQEWVRRCGMVQRETVFNHTMSAAKVRVYERD